MCHHYEPEELTVADELGEEADDDRPESESEPELEPEPDAPTPAED